MSILFEALKRIKTLIILNKNLGYFSLGNLIGNLLGGIFWIILATFVTSDIYGKANFFFSISNSVSAIALLGLPVFVTTYVAKGYSDIRREIASIVLIISIAAALVSYIIFQFATLSILIFGAGFFSISIQDLIGRGSFKEFAIIFIGQKITSLILSLLLFFIIGIDGIFLGYALSYIAFGYKTIMTLKDFTIDFQTIKKKKSFLIDSWLIDISRTISTNSDKLLIAPLFGYAILGIYQASVQILTLQAVIPGIMSLYLLREEASGVDRRYVKIAGFITTAIISIIITVFAPMLVPQIFPHFSGSIPLIQLSTWGAPIMALNAIFSSKLLANEKARPVLTASLLFFVTLSTFIYFLGSTLGAIGLTGALLIAITLQTVINYLSLRKFTNCR